MYFTFLNEDKYKNRLNYSLSHLKRLNGNLIGENKLDFLFYLIIIQSNQSFCPVVEIHMDHSKIEAFTFFIADNVNSIYIYYQKNKSFCRTLS